MGSAKDVLVITTPAPASRRSLNLILLFLISPLFALSQQVYTSPYTQNFPVGLIEEVKREITITPERIVVATETEAGKDIQTFIIKSRTKKEDQFLGWCDLISCTSSDGAYVTFFLIPVTEKVEIIEVVQPQQYDQEKKNYRFLID